MERYTIRRAVASDVAHLSDMLIEAMNGTGVRRRARIAVLEDPRATRYIAGWQRPSDFGAIAVDEQRSPIGAAWARVLPPEAAGDGFVASGVPELTIGVNPQWRSHGVGRDLLRAVLAQARDAGHPRISLAVAPNSFARRLYVTEGFRTIDATDRFEVMVRSFG
jgi:GNAT superfamily N-acetyltransferase